MKKALFYLMAVAAMTVTACEKGNPAAGDPGDAALVAGTWYLRVEDGDNEWAFTEDGKFTITEYLYKQEGSYSVTGTSLTMKASKAWEKDYVRDEMSRPVRDESGEYVLTDWKETGADTKAVTYSVKKLYGGDAMILGGAADEYSGSDDLLNIPLINKEASHLSDIGLIQGKWYWRMFGKGSGARAVVIVNGSNAEIIITPWGERYTGAITYEQGRIQMSNPTFYTSRYQDTENPDVWEHINEEHPEDTPWRMPDGDYYSAYSYIIMPFIVEGNTAYATVANLYSTFQKQQ